MGPMVSEVRRVGRRAIVAALTLGLFVVYLIALPPHLVHHLFDEDSGRLNCPHLSQSQQTPELKADPPTLAPPVLTETPLGLPAGVSASSPDLTVCYPRAPPRSVPSA